MHRPLNGAELDPSANGAETQELRQRAEQRREVLAGLRCSFCGVVGRSIVIASGPGVTRVGCTTCWCGPTDLVDWGQR